LEENDMTKTLVIYRSKSGFTRHYAEWLAKELAADLAPAREAKLSRMLQYDCILYGGGLYAGGIGGIGLIKKNLAALGDRQVIVFATGASPARDGLAAELLAQNFAPEIRDRITFFYLRGGFDYGKLTRIDRLLMNLMKRSIQRKSPEQRTPDERGMLAAFDQPIDFTHPRHIDPILAMVRR
jgi:menaquinone-dependent protoporphyrinogen IX oxidase